MYGSMECMEYDKGDGVLGKGEYHRDTSIEIVS
jgi:hypothetical protein